MSNTYAFFLSLFHAMPPTNQPTYHLFSTTIHQHLFSNTTTIHHTNATSQPPPLPSLLHSFLHLLLLLLLPYNNYCNYNCYSNHYHLYHNNHHRLCRRRTTVRRGVYRPMAPSGFSNTVPATKNWAAPQ